MRSTLIFLPLLAVVSSVLAAPTPNKCGWKPEKPDWKPKWKPDGKFDPKQPVPDPSRINERGVPNPFDEVELVQRIDC
jgi:hypothetical protein